MHYWQKKTPDLVWGQTNLSSPIKGNLVLLIFWQLSGVKKHWTGSMFHCLVCKTLIWFIRYADWIEIIIMVQKETNASVHYIFRKKPLKYQMWWVDRFTFKCLSINEIFNDNFFYTIISMSSRWIFRMLLRLQTTQKESCKGNTRQWWLELQNVQAN